MPSVMIVLSLVLAHRPNRIANIVVGIVDILTIVGTGIAWL